MESGNVVGNAVDTKTSDRGTGKHKNRTHYDGHPGTVAWINIGKGQVCIHNMQRWRRPTNI